MASWLVRSTAERAFRVLASHPGGSRKMILSRRLMLLIPG